MLTARSEALPAALALALVLGPLSGCAAPPPAPAAVPAPRCALLPLEHRIDAERGWGSLSHLLLLNPAESPAEVRITLYFEDREPASFELVAEPRTTTESASSAWPVGAGGRFALIAESAAPLVCQATVGWNSTANDYAAGARSLSPRGARETARSTAPAPFGRRLFAADGIVLQGPGSWLRESEWLAAVVPETEPVAARLLLHAGAESRELPLTLAGRRLTLLFMDDKMPPHRHYGVELAADRPVAAAWLREVRWQDDDEPMAFWSVPLQPAGLDVPRAAPVR